MQKIILVEPDTVLREWCRLHLESERFYVSAFEDVHLALEAVRHQLPDLLLIIATDLHAGAAFALAAAVRSSVHTALVPILFLVPSNDAEAFAHAVSIEPQGAISKPVTRSVLLSTVAMLLKKANEGAADGDSARSALQSTGELRAAAAAGTGLVLDSRHATVLVVVLRNFVSLARALSAKTLDSLLRRFSAAAREAILEHEGWIVRADATGLVVLFEEVPRADRSHASRAIESALAVLVAARRAKAQTAAHLNNVSLPDLSVGCGVHTGDVVIARLSAGSQLGLTLAGQTADLAHRLNGRAKGLGWSVAASESTVAAAGARFQFGRQGSLTDADHGVTLALSEVLGPNPGTARPGELPYMAEIREAVLANTMLATLAGDVDQSTADRTIMVQGKPAREDQTLPELPDRQVVRRVGQKRYVTTLLATHLPTSREEIVKLARFREMSPRFVDAYLEHYQKLSNVEQRNVATVYEIERMSQGGFVALEFLPGGDLSEAIRKKLPVGVSLNCLAQMCLALDAIHDIGMVHGALRAEHFHFRRDRVLVLADFNVTEHVSDALGLAYPVDGNPNARPAARNSAPLPRPRADFEALGKILHAMLTGEIARVSGTDNESQADDLHRATRLPLALSPLQPCLDGLLGTNTERSVDRAEDVLVELLALKDIFPFDIRLSDTDTAAHLRKQKAG